MTSALAALMSDSLSLSSCERGGEGEGEGGEEREGERGQ